MEEEKRGHKGLYWTAAIIILLLALGIFAYKEVAGLRNLQVTITEFSADRAGWTHFRFGFTVHIYNSNPFSVKVGNFKARVYANDVSLTSIELAEPFKIPALYGVEKTFYVDVNYADIGTVIFKAIWEKKLTWKIEGEYNIQLPFGFTFPYKFTSTGSV